MVQVVHITSEFLPVLPARSLYRPLPSTPVSSTATPSPPARLFLVALHAVGVDWLIVGRRLGCWLDHGSALRRLPCIVCGLAAHRLNHERLLAWGHERIVEVEGVDPFFCHLALLLGGLDRVPFTGRTVDLALARGRFGQHVDARLFEDLSAERRPLVDADVARIVVDDLATGAHQRGELVVDDGFVAWGVAAARRGAHLVVATAVRADLEVLGLISEAAAADEVGVADARIRSGRGSVAADALGRDEIGELL